MPDHIPDNAIRIKNIIFDFLNDPCENKLWDNAGEKSWDEPLIGFSRGDDPVFESFKKHIGPFHWTPLEIFSKTFPKLDVKSGELVIISWVLPQTEATRADNRKASVYPAERWARSRIFGEQINVRLRKHVEEILMNENIHAVAPMLSPHWTWQTSEKYGFASNWSERHVAYASGLGTFGLCDGLITSKGKAMRVGSVVANLRIPPTERPYSNHREYCLFFSQGICGKCIPRCPVGALSEDGHDKAKCFDHLAMAIAPHVKANYGFDGYGCGLCQTEVPCESRIPTKNDVETT